jgi:high-affinity Fe2+/Pb2+ permease
VDDLDKYVLEQAKVEVEHTRSWPTKILAFYIAINAGVVTALFSLTGRTANVLFVPKWAKVLLTIAVLGLLVWALLLLVKNHKSYLQHRNLQIQFQKANTEVLKERYSVPSPWLSPNEVNLSTRWLGWSFYFYLLVVVAALGVTGIWVS